MPQRVSLIHREVAGSVPVEYALEPGEEFEFASVRAKISGAGASGTFIMVLEALSQDGKIITQSPIDQEFAVGDTGALTWAPFLRRQAAATPAGALSVEYIHREWDVGAAKASGSWTKVDFSAGTTVNTEASRFATAGAGGDDIDVTGTGFYMIKFQVKWDPFAGSLGVMLRSSAWTYDKIVYYEEIAGAGTSAFGGPMIEDFQRFASGTSRIEFLVRQESGAAQTLETAMCEIAYLGSFANEPTDPDSY